MKLLAPDLRVVAMAEPIRELANRVRRSERAARERMGRWESEVEAFNLLLLSACHALAAAKLAKSSVSFVPSAHLNARAAIETGVRALWLLQPEESFEREGRWLVHLESEATIREHLGKVSTTEIENAKAIRALVSAVRAKLPQGTPVPKSLPHFEAMLSAIGMPEKYLIYRLFSQTTHGTHYGSGVFRQHLGNQATFGQFMEAKDWWLPLTVQWWSLAQPAETLAERCGFDELRVPEALYERFARAKKALAKA